MKHTDCLKNEIKVGDKVIFTPPYSRRLDIGEVIKLTPKMVTIEYGEVYKHSGKKPIYSAYPEQTYVIPKQSDNMISMLGAFENV